MAESTSTRGRRPRRSTRVSQRLERARQRNADQLAEQRAREQRVEEALAEFVEAGDAIAAEESGCEDKVAAYQRKIDALRAEAQTRVADQHTRQARAALAIHEAGRTVEQVADLLELRSEKEARRLIAAGRESPEQEASGSGPDEKPAAVDGGAVMHIDSEVPTGSSGEHARPDGGDGQPDRPDAGFAPAAVADGGGQSA